MSLPNAKLQAHLKGVDAAEAASALMRLAGCNQLSPHARDVLQALLDLCTCGLELPISETLTEFEKQLVRLADKTTIHQQNEYFDSVHVLKRGRAEVAPRFLRSLENSLARLHENVTLPHSAPGARSAPLNLALTDSIQMDESHVLSDIATKVELRVREPLFALGRRFGALAGSPCVAVEMMPLGPRSIVEALRYGTLALDLMIAHRLVLYRCFERVVMNQIGSLYAALNNCLIEQGILPHLHTLSTGNGAADTPFRPAATSLASRGSPGNNGGIGETRSKPASSGVRPISAAIRPAARSDFFATLRQLLDECRRAETYTATGADLQAVLAALQACQPVAAIIGGTPSLRSAEEIKQEILVLLHERCAHGRTPRIGEEDSDAIELTAMLFEFLSRRARPHGVAHRVLVKLQLPILRVAIADKHFFSDATHSVRRLLNEFVEAAQFWIDENEAERDAALVDRLQRLTDLIARDQNKAAVFAAASEELSQQLAALVRRREEVAERRRIEATAADEKLARRARELAAAAIGERIARARPNEFLRALLECVWTDVLAAALSRDGEDSVDYRRRLEVVDQLLAAAVAKGNGTAESLAPAMRAEVESGLTRVGLHDDDIRAVMRKLFARASDDQPEDPISQTELAIKLKLQARRGAGRKAASEPIRTAGAPVLESEQRAAIDLLRTLQAGTWFEFGLNPEGHAVRYQLSWDSTDSQYCLFLDQHGVVCARKTMQDVAYEMASGRARIIYGERESLVDQAWAAICDTLADFSGRKQDSPHPTSAWAARGTGQTRNRLIVPAERLQHEEPRTLLLVDDEMGILRALTRVLRADGYRILCATGAAEAMEMLGEHDVQVIVSDQRMPNVSGTQFLTEVKATHPNTVRILLSGYSDAVSVTEAINRGAIYKFLTKPWDDDDIRMQIRDAFQACELH